MPTFISAGVHRDPIRVRSGNVIVSRVRIGARDDDYAEFPATGDEFTQDVTITEPLAAMMKRNLRGIIRDATATAQTNRVRLCALEIIQPEREIELAGVILRSE